MRIHNHMRNILLLLLLFVVVITAVGCKAKGGIVLDIIDYNGYNDYLKGRGYNDCVFLASGVSDYGDTEAVGFCKGGVDWYGFVSVQNDDEHLSLYCEKMAGRSMYLIEKDGIPCVLVYAKDIEGTNVNYQYEVFRFDEQGEKDVLEERSVTCSASDSNDTAAKELLSDCKKYLDDASQVVIDPYRLKGAGWPLEDEVGLGTVPNHITLYPHGTTGYVKIKNSQSWLNLREGPGTNYPYIYLNPGDKKSIVKQAQGSPVTILERIETKDEKNPVWVKIRIRYEGQEIVGYSSKTFIREEGE